MSRRDNGNDSDDSSSPRVFVLLENPKQTTNWGPILRCCAAFGIPQVFAVGYDKCAVQGSHGSHKHVELSSFPTHAQAVTFLRETCQVSQFLGLVGGVSNCYSADGYPTELRELTMTNQKTKEQKAELYLYVKPDMNENTETTDGKPSQSHSHSEKVFPKSFPVSAKPYSAEPGSNCCLVIGRRSQGLPIALADICDSFVHVPTIDLDLDDDDSHSCNEGLLNMIDLESCLSIVLHTFYLHSKISMDKGRNLLGQKYHVEKAKKGSIENKEEERIQRLAKRQQLLDEANDDETRGQGGSDLFQSSVQDDDDY